jgi:hypothetical protein
MPIVLNSLTNGQWIKKLIVALKEHDEAVESATLLEAGGLPLLLVGGVGLGVVEALKLDVNLELERVQPGVVLQFLYRYTDPRSMRWQRMLRRRAGDLAKLLSKTEMLMKQATTRVSAAVPEFEISCGTWKEGLEAPTVAMLTSAIQQTSILREHYRQVSSQKGEARDEYSLVYLCLFIESKTGRNHWVDIANLLEAAFQAHRCNEAWDADRVRKVIRRFEKDHRTIYKEMRAFIVENPHDYDPKFTVKRSTRNRRGSEFRPTEPVIHTVPR